MALVPRVDLDGVEGVLVFRKDFETCRVDIDDCTNSRLLGYEVPRCPSLDAKRSCLRGSLDEEKVSGTFEVILAVFSGDREAAWLILSRIF